MNPDAPTPQPQVPPPEAPQPASAPAPTPAPQPQSTIITGGGNKKKMILIGVVVAVIALAGIAYGVYAYMTNTPDYLMRQAVDQLGKQKALAAKFRITSGTADNGITFSGDIAVRGDTSNPKNGEFVIGLGTGERRVALTTRVVDDALYFQTGVLSNIPTLLDTFAPGTGEMYNTPEALAMLTDLSNQWFVLTKEELASLSQTAGGGASDSINAEEVKKIKEIYDKHSFLKADKTFADEPVEGVNSAHFSLKIDKDALVAFMTELKAANLKSLQVTDEQINEAKTAVDQTKNTSFEVWVARDSRQLKQVSIASTEAGNEGTFTLTMAPNLPQLEKLEKPVNVRPFSELSTLLFGPALMPQPTFPTDCPNCGDFDPSQLDPEVLKQLQQSSVDF